MVTTSFLAVALRTDCCDVVCGVGEAGELDREGDSVLGIVHVGVYVYVYDFFRGALKVRVIWSPGWA